MFSIFLEGAETALFPCSIAIAVLGLFAIFFRMNSLAAIGTYVVSFFFFSLLRISGVTSQVESNAIRATLLVIAAGLAIVQIYRNPAFAIEINFNHIAVVVLAFVAAHFWKPCVGLEFGKILNADDYSNVDNLVKYFLYSVGLSIPLIIIAFLVWMFGDEMKEKLKSDYVAAVFIVIAAGGTYLGFGDSLIEYLYLIKN